MLLGDIIHPPPPIVNRTCEACWATGEGPPAEFGRFRPCCEVCQGKGYVAEQLGRELAEHLRQAQTPQELIALLERQFPKMAADERAIRAGGAFREADLVAVERGAYRLLLDQFRRVL